MCIVFLGIHTTDNYKLIIANNRDEFFARPTEPLQAWPHRKAHDGGLIYGGYDAEVGRGAGTWLGITENGRFSVLTNFREANQKLNMLSRGALTSDFLSGNDDPETYLRKLEEKMGQYNGFNLIVGKLDGEEPELWYLSNRHKIGVMKLPLKDVHGMSNGPINSRNWPKVQKGKHNVSELLKKTDSETEDAVIDELFGIMRDSRVHENETDLPNTGVPKEVEWALSSIRILPQPVPLAPGFSGIYGTRATTVILVDHNNRVRIVERTFGVDDLEHPTQNEADHQFLIHPQKRQSEDAANVTSGSGAAFAAAAAASG
eukprot:Clim_evm78s225 gene=Clim_evmTU78s225